MLSRLYRAITRAPRLNQDAKSIQESMERNLNTITDDSNYTKDRVLRVIRSYYFLSNDSFKLQDNKVWGKDPIVQESIQKLVPLVNQLEPDSINLLIVNLGILNVYNPSVWREIESQFLEISHRYLPTSSIVRVCEAFSQAKRKNEEVWAILCDKFVNEIYSAGQLEGPDAARAYKALLMSGVDNPELLDKLRENVAETIENIGIRLLNGILEALTFQETNDPEFEALIFSRAIDILSNLNPPRYNKVFYFASKIKNHEVLSKLEELILENIENENLLQISKAIYNYSDDDMLANSERTEFAKTLCKYYNENREQISSNFGDRTFLVESMDLKFLYIAFKMNNEVNDNEVLKAYQNIDTSERLLPSILKIKSDFEVYLKEKNLI